MHSKPVGTTIDYDDPTAVILETTIHHREEDLVRIKRDNASKAGNYHCTQYICNTSSVVSDQYRYGPIHFDSCSVNDLKACAHLRSAGDHS